MTVPKRVLLLFSDTGGGHRAAAEAIRDALILKHGDAVRVELVDVFRSYSPFPFKYMPELYPIIINRGKTPWGISYRWTNTRGRAKLISHGMYASIEKGLKRMLREHPADVVVCVHSLLTRPSLHAFTQLEKRPPFIVVVTDLVSTHMFWYDKRTEMCLVPTHDAYIHGVESGLHPNQMRVTGLPVHPSFAKGLKDKASAREELGWDPELPAILLVGGGEGMGPLYKVARAINDEKLKCQVIVIAGRNKELKDQLEACDWNQPTRVYPFVTNMSLLMGAADVLVTKAGPATISEACIAGLPQILYDAIPGQETGNVDFVVENEAGVFAPSAQAVTTALREWLTEDGAEMKRRSENARRISHPDAVWDIAEEVWHYAQQQPVAGDVAARSTIFSGLAW
jgi:1,2-diacylglycerol 3-beta-galactosyltransferase